MPGAATPTTVQQRADLSVSLSASPEVLTVPGELTYTFTVTNAGPSHAVDVLAILELPEGASLAASDPDCAASAGGAGTVECHLGDLAAGDPPVERSVHVAFPTLPASRTATATVHVSSATPEPDSLAALNNTAEATTILAVSNEADLTLEKSASEDSLPMTTPLFYTLVVSNKGPAKATGVRVEDRLPGGLVFFGSTACARLEPGNLVVWTVGDLDKDAERRCTFSVATPQLGTFLNKAIVTSPDVADPDPDNNTSEVTTVVRPGGPPPEIFLLVLPYFEADRDPAGVATLFAVRNPSDNPVCTRYNTFSQASRGRWARALVHREPSRGHEKSARPQPRRRTGGRRPCRDHTHPLQRMRLDSLHRLHQSDGSDR